MDDYRHYNQNQHHHHHLGGSTKVVPDFRSSTPKSKASPRTLLGTVPTTTATATTPNASNGGTNKPGIGLRTPRRSGGNITATSTPKVSRTMGTPGSTASTTTTTERRSYNHSGSSQINSNGHNSHSNYHFNLEAQVAELQKSVSRLALENEELRHELNQVCEENEQLHQTLQESEVVQSRTRQQLAAVTQAAYTLYEKFRAFKCRYYEEQRLMGD